MKALPHTVIVVLLVGAQLLSGCAHGPRAALPRQLFDRIEVGMSRTEVDALLGDPVSLNPTGPPPLAEVEAWYLAPPELDPIESPFAFGSIGITFTQDGCVAAKRLNPQCREPAVAGPAKR